MDDYWTHLNERDRAEQTARRLKILGIPRIDATHEHNFKTSRTVKRLRAAAVSKKGRNEKKKKGKITIITHRRTAHQRTLSSWKEGLSCVYANARARERCVSRYVRACVRGTRWKGTRQTQVRRAHPHRSMPASRK